MKMTVKGRTGTLMLVTTPWLSLCRPVLVESNWAPWPFVLESFKVRMSNNARVGVLEKVAHARISIYFNSNNNNNNNNKNKNKNKNNKNNNKKVRCSWSVQLRCNIPIGIPQVASNPLPRIPCLTIRKSKSTIYNKWYHLFKKSHENFSHQKHSNKDDLWTNGGVFGRSKCTARKTLSCSRREPRSWQEGIHAPWTPRVKQRRSTPEKTRSFSAQAVPLEKLGRSPNRKGEFSSNSPAFVQVFFSVNSLLNFGGVPIENSFFQTKKKHGSCDKVSGYNTTTFHWILVG